MATKTIVLLGDPLHKEDVADGTITPGQLCEFDSSNGNIQRHSTANGNAVPMFAIENDLKGADIADDYVATDVVLYVVPRNGDEINAILTTSQTIKKGDLLVSAGDGNLRKFAVNSGEPPDFVKRVVAQAMEDKTTTGSTARIIVQVV